MSIRRFLLIAALAAGAGSPLAAQQDQQVPSAKPITFNDAIAIALTQNVAVRQAQNAAVLGDANVKAQKMQLLPDLKLSVSGSDNVGGGLGQAGSSFVGQQSMSQSLSSGLSSTLTLFDGGKTRASIRSAEASEDASSSDLTRAKQTAVFTVASDFVALANQQEQLGVQQENQTAQQAQQDLIQKLVDGGTRPVSDLYQQQATVASAKLAVAQAKSAVELAKVDLIQALQLDPAGSYEFVPPAVNAADTSATYSLDSLMARAYANRADLKAQSSRVDAADQDVKGAAASRLPTVSVTGAYSSAYNSAAGVGLADQLDQRRGGSIGIGISIPIFDRGTSSLAKQQAELGAENARLALDSEKQAVALDVRRAYLDQISAKEQLNAAQAQLAAAIQATDMTQKRYQAGAATLVEVTQARGQQVQAASAAATAKNNLVLHQAVMSYYTGELDPTHMTLGS
jgi:outer membrane protein